MRCEQRGEPINSYALVAYIPGPLGRFLDDLRRDLVPGCLPRAHVTILPPRTLPVSAEQAWSHVWDRIHEVPPFEVRLGEVRMFDTTSVIYLDLASGRPEFDHLHAALNLGPVGCAEIFEYHPHVTLAQDLSPEEAAVVRERAREAWTTWHGPRSFSAETVTFVQNTSDNRWMDLAELSLGAVPVR